jgi:hypothetical protein
VAAQNAQRRTKNNPKETSVELFQRGEGHGDAFLPRIISSDESRVHHYDPLTKRQSSEMHHQAPLRKDKFKVQTSVGKVMASVS